MIFSRSLTILIMIGLVLISHLAAAEGERTPRMTLNTFVEDLAVSNEAKSEMYRLTGDSDGFGLRLRDILSLNPDAVSAEWVAYLSKLNLAFGLTEAEIGEYGALGYIERIRFSSVEEARARDELSYRALSVLKRLRDPSAEKLAKLYSVETLKIAGAGPLTIKELSAFVGKFGYELRGKTKMKRAVFLNFYRFEQFVEERNERESGLQVWTDCEDTLEADLRPFRLPF